MKIVPNPPPQPLSAGLRRFLYLTAAITGAAILVVEILGAKMLSPYVGSSHFVWTAQIAVTLLSLALGYYFGGWLVDRSLALHRLYNCIAAAAIYLALSVLAVQKVAYSFLHLSLGLGAFLSSLFLFFIPLTLLAATGPFLIRVLTQSMDGVGGQVGRLSAVSTIGSVAGTVLIGYILLPFLPNSTTMFLTAGVLIALVAVFYATKARNKKSLATTTASSVIFLILAILLEPRLHGSPKHWTRLHRSNSNFGELQVLDHASGSRRYYLNDYLVQNTYDPQEKASLSLFTYMLHELAWAYSDSGRLQNALCIGVGIGIVPGALAREQVQVDAIEINPAIIPVARQYFDFDPAAMNLTIGDGRFFINKSQKHYDTIILDAFLGDSSPSHLMTREAFAEMARLLGANGVLVINSFGEFRPGRDFFLSSLDKTLHAVFKNVKIHASGNGNVFFAASQRDLKLQPRENIKFPPTDPEIQSQFNSALTEAPPPNPTSGIVLTDDYNPVDFYDAVNREHHRRTLAFAIRNL